MPPKKKPPAAAAAARASVPRRRPPAASSARGAAAAASADGAKQRLRQHWRHPDIEKAVSGKKGAPGALTKELSPQQVIKWYRSTPGLSVAAKQELDGAGEGAGPSAGYDTSTLPSALPELDVSLIEPDAFCLFYGKRRTGKSVALKSLLLRVLEQNPDAYYGVIVVSNTATLNYAYDPYVPVAAIIDKYSEPLLRRVCDLLQQMNLNQHGLRYLLILDDCVDADSMKRSQALRTLAQRGRHMGVSVWITTQYPYCVSPDTRENADWEFALAQLNKNSLQWARNNFVMGSKPNARREDADAFVIRNTMDFGVIARHISKEDLTAPDFYAFKADYPPPVYHVGAADWWETLGEQRVDELVPEPGKTYPTWEPTSGEPMPGLQERKLEPEEEEEEEEVSDQRRETIDYARDFMQTFKDDHEDEDADEEHDREEADEIREEVIELGDMGRDSKHPAKDALEPDEDYIEDRGEGKGSGYKGPRIDRGRRRMAAQARDFVRAQFGP